MKEFRKLLLTITQIIFMIVVLVLLTMIYQGKHEIRNTQVIDSLRNDNEILRRAILEQQKANDKYFEIVFYNDSLLIKTNEKTKQKMDSILNLDNDGQYKYFLSRTRYRSSSFDKGD